jgi:hypothetical protein
MLHIGAGSLGLGDPIAAVMFKPAVGLRVPDGTAMTVRRLRVWHAFPPSLHVGMSNRTLVKRRNVLWVPNYILIAFAKSEVANPLR